MEREMISDQMISERDHRGLTKTSERERFGRGDPGLDLGSSANRTHKMSSGETINKAKVDLKGKTCDTTTLPNAK